jgi:hypothetical protein
MLPASTQITSPNLDARLRLWEITLPPRDEPEAGKQLPSYSLLHQPAAWSLRFTPALGR